MSKAITPAAPWQYVSIDSAPPAYACSRSPLVALSFLVAFVLVSAVLLRIHHPTLADNYTAVLRFVSGENIAVPPTLHFRIFFLAYAATFCPFAAGSWWQRVLLWPVTVAACLVAMLVSDLVLVQFSKAGGPGPFSLAGDIITGYATLLTIGSIIFASIRLPAGVIVRTKLKQSPLDLLLLMTSIVLTIVIVVSIFLFATQEVDALRGLALLGGLGPGLFLFTPVFMWLTFFLGLLRRPRPCGYTKPSVAFLVAALNEAHNVAHCIRSLDAAAAAYRGVCRLYLVDNGSTDDTVLIARRELERCRALTGQVLHCPAPGKARALNHGLRFVAEEILVRVDADTVVEPLLLTKIVPYFSNPVVGGVGGLPLPKDTSYLLAKMRLVEVYFHVAFQRTGHSGINAVNVIPGIMSAYRSELVKELGGFAEGMNGEDTDATVRIGRLGYRIVVDPRILVYSEVPRTLAHLREQRLRWSRSFFHVLARNKSAIRMLQGARGLWTLPMSFIAVFRRTIIVPVLVYAGLVALIDPTALFLRQGAAVGAVVVGPPLLMTVGALLVHRRLDLVPYVPAYLVLRLFRAYIALEALFTLTLKFGPSHSIPGKDNVSTTHSTAGQTAGLGAAAVGQRVLLGDSRWASASPAKKLQEFDRRVGVPG